jgi:anaerobic selenocysteine-containing dehydrogenase
MGDEKQHSDIRLSRRTFLKATGALGAAAAIQGAAPSLLKNQALAAAPSAQAEEQLIPTFCAMCGPSSGCGILAKVVNGKFVGIESMPECPTNNGKNCPKAHAAPQWVYSPDRIKYPMKRVGEKGEGKFQRITWDEAIQLIADKLTELKAQYGPESLGTVSPAYRSYSQYIYRFLMTHGSPNYGHSGICAVQRMFTFSYTLGGTTSADYANADLILLWGAQPVFSGSSKGGVTKLISAKERGAKIIAIKPTIEPDVAKADMWVPIRPGTDAALGLAMINVIINENLYDAAFVSDWCYGFDQLKEHVQQYPPEWAEPITGVPAEQIKTVARMYATTPKAALDVSNGPEHARAANDAIRSLGILMAITGHLDKKGCNVWGSPSKMPSPKGVLMFDLYTQEWVDKLLGYELPKELQPFSEGTSCSLYRLWNSVLGGEKYPVHAIIAPGSQSIASTRGTKRIMEALNKLEFFVILDVMKTSDMPWADVVVPVSTGYENDHPFETSGPWIMARNQVIERLGEYKSDYEFWLDLGTAMGYGEDWWNGDIKAHMDWRLEPLEMTYEELRTKYPKGRRYEGNPPEYEQYEKRFAAKSTRIDKGPYLPQGKVALYNTTFESIGFTPMPVWRELPEGPTATPELLEKYPLLMSDYHTSRTYNAAWLRNVPYLREVEPYPFLQIYPDTAKARGIKDGDWVRVEGPHGWIQVKAQYYPGIRPDVVYLLHGWWQGCQELGMEDFPIGDGGANSNNMYTTDPEKMYDPIITAMTSQTLVQVSKA